MKQIFLILTFCLISGNITAKAEMQEQQFPCSKNKTIYQCGIWTDGIYAIKTKTYDGQPKFEIEDFVFDVLKDGGFDNGNIVVKKGIVKQCKKCRKTNGQKSQFLIHKYIVFNKIPNYQKYIKTNRIDDLQKFNKNGYFLAFKNKKDKNDTKYLFIYKDDHNKLKAVYNYVAAFLYFYDENYFSENFDLFYLDADNLTYEKFNDGAHIAFCDKDDATYMKDDNLAIDKNKATIEGLQAQYDRVAKEVQNNKKRDDCFLKLYSLESDGRLFNEDIKKVGDNIAIFNQTKREKIENILKKSDYDFLK